MIELLSRIFIKDYKNYSDKTVRKKYGTLSGGVGIVVNILLSAIKMFVGIISSSVAITADAFNNLSDAGSSVITLISFKFSAKPADKKHPFGHARFEYISSMIVSFLILFVGFELFCESFKILFGFSESKNTSFDALTIVMLVLSIVFKLWLGYFYKKIGKRINSKIVEASSVDSITDSIATGSILVSAIIIKFTGFVFLDAIIGIIVSVVILISGAKILNDTKNALLGESPIDDVYDKIKRVIKDYPDVIEIHDLLVHNYGPGHVMASFHAEVDGSKDIYLLHDVIDKLEREMRERYNVPCTIHIDPVETNDIEVKKHKDQLLEVIEEINPVYKIHDFRIAIGKNHNKMIFDLVVPYETKQSEEEIIREIMSKISDKMPGHFCVITVDKE